MRTKTILKEATFAKLGDAFVPVALPHTWNNLDGQDGGNDYWRGIGVYKIPVPNPTAGKKQYIQFEGANHVATVYCNGRELGTHKGGFSTFRFDLTGALKPADNEVTVVVTNAVSDIYPQTADFTFYGGLYRNVTFIETAPAHFDLMKVGTQGVFVTPHCSGKTRLDVFPVNADGCYVSVELKNAEGEVVGKTFVEASAHNDIIIDIANPHLWHGVEDPYCYTAVVSLISDEKVVDCVEVTYGYRSYSVDPNTGFWLNGKQFPLHGVSRHQDRKDKGWAISDADHEQDIGLIKELGANTIRLAHYQHAQHFYDCCDKTGFILWAEIPFISRFIPTKEAYDNTISQMTELVAQNYNHPAICFWGISNEILIGADNEPLRKNLRDVAKVAKTLDPSRMTTMAQVSSTPMDSEHNYITDVVSYNHYFGWYGGDVAQNGPWFDKFHAMNPSIPLGISEYGAENITKWHSATPMNHDYTEEYANHYHQEMLKTFAARPYLWSTHVWNCFDFAADARNEGGVIGMNNKGLITYDRTMKKDAFYIYKAWWNPEPMVYVAGRRFADRAPEERNVTVYTNCDNITLIVNGEAVETKAAVDHMVVFENVALKDGENTVTAKSCCGIEDTITLNGVAVHNDAYTLPDLAEAMQVGNWFDEVSDNDESEEIVIIDGYYNVNDPMGVVLANEECLKITKGWYMAQGNLTVASMLTTLRDMMGDRPLREGSILGGEPSPKLLAQLNRQLSKVKK